MRYNIQCDRRWQKCFIFFSFRGILRYGSVKSAHRRTGKIKGIERILGTVVDPTQIQESLIEVTSGQAKYEHHHRAIVWRCSRLPKDGQGIAFFYMLAYFYTKIILFTILKAPTQHIKWLFEWH